MHQPLYKSAATGDYLLPWVRLHAAKGYLDIASKALEFPEAAQTINVVPSLVLQIKDYLEGGVTDRFRTLTLKPASELSPDDKRFILKYFFSINWKNCIEPVPRYWELLRKRGTTIAHTDLEYALGRFTDSDFRDLQTLFNLAWLGFTAMREPLAKELSEKARDYSEEDKAALIEFQDECLMRVLKSWRKLALESRVEFTTTPFYHPILPLVTDTANARFTTTQEVISRIAFNHPGDARAQIRRGLSFISAELGISPRGMWPSEGSVSEDVAEIMAAEGISYIATDRGVLDQSKVKDDGFPATHLEPYVLKTSSGEVAIFFRDTKLADAIGFEYHKRPLADAAGSFIAGVKAAAADWNCSDRPPLVSVILDGENPWEYYEDGGESFLTRLFESLSSGKDGVLPIAFSEYLDKFGAEREIESLHPGSWIHHSFGIWIGDGEKDLAWKLLSETRSFVNDTLDEGGIPPETAEHVMEHIYAAEGSDWFWWYGEPFNTDFDPVFDLLFRQHLIRVYELLGRPVPGELKQPITGKGVFTPELAPVDALSPTIDGRVTSFYEWIDAGLYSPKISGTVMARDEAPLFKAVYWGYDGEKLFLRVDLSDTKLINSGLFLIIRFYHPCEHIISVSFDAGTDGYTLYKFASEHLYTYERRTTAAVLEIAEIMADFASLGIGEADFVSFALYIVKDGRRVERCPFDGTISFSAPPRNYKALMWKV